MHTGIQISLSPEHVLKVNKQWIKIISEEDNSITVDLFMAIISLSLAAIIAVIRDSPRYLLHISFNLFLLSTGKTWYAFNRPAKECVVNSIICSNKGLYSNMNFAQVEGCSLKAGIRSLVIIDNNTWYNNSNWL